MRSIELIAGDVVQGIDLALLQHNNGGNRETVFTPNETHENKAGYQSISFQIRRRTKRLSPGKIRKLDRSNKQKLLFPELDSDNPSGTLPVSIPTKSISPGASEKVSVTITKIESCPECDNLNLIPSPNLQSFQPWLDKAEQIIRHDRDYPTTIIAAYLYQPRPLTDIEVAALIIHYRGLHSRLAKIEAQKLLTEMEEAERVLHSVNTESDSGLVVRKMALAMDYSLTGLTLKATAAKGEKLNPREQKEIARIAKEFKRLQGEQAKTDRMDKAIEKEQPKKKWNKKNTSKAQLSKVRALQFGTKTIVDDSTH